MEQYFNIRYEFDVQQVHEAIAKQVASGSTSYICVADGVILNTANREPEYKAVVNGGMFSICDSSFVPLYIRLIYGRKYPHYYGSQIFSDIITSRKYRMAFLGGNQNILNNLRTNLQPLNPDVAHMLFYELPFCEIEDFDYPAIAEIVNNDGSEIVWVSLGAPRQEQFMSRLRPHLKRGVMIAVGAAFKFYSGVEEHRAPKWMVRNHLEFVYRLFISPSKQAKRCYWIVRTLPGLLFGEWQRKRKSATAVKANQ